MYTCTVCGSHYRLGTACADCERAAALLKLAGEDVDFLIGWVKDVARIQVEEHIDHWHRDHQDD